MEEFRLFLHANQWKGTHIHKQMKKFALLARRTGSTYSKTYQQLAQAWNMEESRYWVRDRNVRWVIKNYGQEDQRTDAWHNARSTMITASEVGDVIDGTPATRQEVMMRKLQPTKTETRNGNFLNNPLMWGTVLEPIAKEQQERDTACAIKDVSCVRHRKYPFLGASPDGIIQAPTDRERHHCLVEFKCPKSRKIGGEIPKNQVHQMQLQMACTGVDECEQVEFQQEVVTQTQQVDCADKPKGIIALQDNGKTEIWDKPVGAIEDGRLIFWILQGVSRDLVVRDPAWLSNHLPELRKFWEEVEQHRENNTKPEKPGVLKLEL